MKIQAVDQQSHQPLKNQKLQLEVRGKDSGYLSTTTDGNGYCMIDDKYKDQQISQANRGGQSQWIKAEDGAKLPVNHTQPATGNKQKEPSHR